jgi:hypothetical protein
MHFTLGPRMALSHTYLTRLTHSNLLCSHQQIWTDPLTLKRRVLTQFTPRRLINPRVHTQLLSHNSQWSGGKKSSFCWQPATRLTGPTSPTCDQYDQYLLMWDNLLILNWHRRGLQPWRCLLFKSHSSTFPTDGPPLFT